MVMNYPLEAWHVEKIREFVSEFGKFIVWNRDASNRARILVKIHVPDMLEIPISHVLCENTDDIGHGHSWTVVNYILQANLIEGLGVMMILYLLMVETPILYQICLLEVSGKMLILYIT
jgi:hypothetical protein